MTIPGHRPPAVGPFARPDLTRPATFVVAGRTGTAEVPLHGWLDPDPRTIAHPARRRHPRPGIGPSPGPGGLSLLVEKRLNRAHGSAVMARGVGRGRAAAVPVRRSDLGCVGRHHAVRRRPSRRGPGRRRPRSSSPSPTRTTRDAPAGARDREGRQRRKGDDRPGDRRLAQGRRLPLVRQAPDRHLCRRHHGPAPRRTAGTPAWGPARSRSRRPGRNARSRRRNRTPKPTPRPTPTPHRPRRRPGRSPTPNRSGSLAGPGLATDARARPPCPRPSRPPRPSALPPIIVALGGIGGIVTGGPGDPDGPAAGSNGRAVRLAARATDRRLGPAGGPHGDGRSPGADLHRPDRRADPRDHDRRGRARDGLRAVRAPAPGRRERRRAVRGGGQRGRLHAERGRRRGWHRGWHRGRLRRRARCRTTPKR